MKESKIPNNLQFALADLPSFLARFSERGETRDVRDQRAEVRRQGTAKAFAFSKTALSSQAQENATAYRGLLKEKRSWRMALRHQVILAMVRTLLKFTE